MTRELERYFSPFICFLDCVSVLLSFVLSGLLSIRAQELAPFRWDRDTFFLPILFIAIVLCCNFWQRRRAAQARKLTAIMAALALPCVLAGTVLALFATLSNSSPMDYARVLMITVIAWLLLLMSRVLLFTYVRFQQKKGYHIKYVLFAGTAEKARKAARRLEENPGWGFEVIGFLTDNAGEKGTFIANHKVLGAMEDLPEVLGDTVVDLVFFEGNVDSGARLRQLSHVCATIGVDLVTDEPSLLMGHGPPSVEFRKSMSAAPSGPATRSPEKLFVKRSFDVCASAALIILALPLWIVIPMLIRRDSPGPVFYVQKRVGRHGRVFNMFKFRTMVVSADRMQEEMMDLNEMSGPAFKIREDPRLTRIGRFLRRTNFDELPQLFNVFAGTMSLVGPRPSVMTDVRQYTLPQRKRLSVAQGLTCLWEATGKNELDFDEWMKLDLQYVENWSLTLDLKILLMTIGTLISRRGAA